MANENSHLKNLRATLSGGITTAFEEFCCQLFRRAPEVNGALRFKRIHGAGGDGGVEAIWELSNGTVWGLQAKWFWQLRASEKAQMKKSLDEAVANYPNLTRYTFCIPKALTGKKGAKSGKKKYGDHEVVAGWINEWTGTLKTQKRTVAIEIWEASELLLRLTAADVSGGMRRYWFDQVAFTDAWFQQRLAGARAAAGPRYSPELLVDTHLNKALEAFGRSETWQTEIDSLSDGLVDALENWTRAISIKKSEMEAAFPTSLESEAQAALSAAKVVEGLFAKVPEHPSTLSNADLRKGVADAIAKAAALEPAVRSQLIATHGNHADTVGFRQWSAEMQASFPMSPLDNLRDLLTALRAIEAAASRTEGELPSASAMLVTGPAGIGKTHGIIDVAHRRQDDGLRSIVVFGEDFSVEDPWTTVSKRLGLGSALGYDELLDALEASAEASGLPLIIFIDALNETRPERKKWQAWLPAMAQQVAQRQNLKLCCSCRDTFVSATLPKSPYFPSVLHNGFADQEYEAILKFFEHYGLGAPAEPLFQAEFANPLFLHLVCSALKTTKQAAVPLGRQGFQAILDVLLTAKNEVAAENCDYDVRDNLVKKAVLALARLMAASTSRALPYRAAKLAVDAVSKSDDFSRSLFHVLETEALITVIEKSSGTTQEVRFAFERMGDYFLAEALLAGITDVRAASQTGGSLHKLFATTETARDNAGVLEALANILPATHMVELVELATDIDRNEVLAITLKAIQWRDPTSIRSSATNLIVEALNNGLSIEALDALYSVAFRPGHPLNSHYLDRLLRRLPMLNRDPYWASLLEHSFSNWSKELVAGSVARVINTALKSRLDKVPAEVADLWCTLLIWHFASPNRRIRDRSTKAVVKLLLAQPAVCKGLLVRFGQFEDEYVVERVLVSVYGALCIKRDPDTTETVSQYAYDTYFAPGSGPPDNASIRDHARLIIELSIDVGRPPRGLDIKKLRPPYRSAWPISLPAEDEVEQFAKDTKRFPELNLGQQFNLAMGTDFARYVIDSRLNHFEWDLKNDRRGIYRWFLKQAVDLGYPGPNDSCAKFDRGLLGTFGGGRGKPGWAERLGKKYYWIFLRRLVGRVADHCNYKNWSDVIAPRSNLQAIDLRDIDPTDLRSHLPKSTIAEWMTGPSYEFIDRDDPALDAEWVSKKDLPKVERALVLKDDLGDEWFTLRRSIEWRGKRLQKGSKTYRYISQSIDTLTVPMSERVRVEKMLKDTQDISFARNEPHDYRGYLGEYPDTRTYCERIASKDIRFDRESEGIVFEHTCLRQLKGGEWEYDHSGDGRAPGLTVPSPALIDIGKLSWDGKGGWRDAEGKTQIIDVHWASEDASALLIRSEYLEGYMTANKLALVIVGHQTKHIAGDMSSSGGLHQSETAIVRSNSKNKIVRERLELPKKAKSKPNRTPKGTTATIPAKRKRANKKRESN